MDSQDSPTARGYISAICERGMPEATFDLALLRTLHAVSCEPWTGRNELALWAEWNHPLETSTRLSATINWLRQCHWERFIEPGSITIDIGGHSGDTAVPIALFAYDNRTHTKGTVIVVEPNPAVIPILRLNLSFNTHLADFFIAQAAVTQFDTDNVLLADYGSAGCNGGVLESGLSEPVASKIREVAGTPYVASGISMASLLKDVAQQTSSQRVGFIKIDCEGYDKEIIRPCRNLFAETRPVLYIEWFAWFTQEDDADLFSVIEAIDYLPYEPTTLRRADISRRVPDLLCFHKDAQQPVL